METFGAELLIAAFTLMTANDFNLGILAVSGATKVSVAAHDATSDDAGAITSHTNEALQLEVFLNGRPTNRIGEFFIRSGRLFVRRSDLSDLGLRIPSSASQNVDGLVALEGLGGLSARIDHAGQSLYITADEAMLLPTLLENPSGLDDVQVESGTGATLNYDLVGTKVSGQQFASGAAEIRTFSRLGVFSSGLLFHGNSNDDRNGDHSTLTRLDTTYVYSDPKSLRRYRAGDFITGALPWTRAVRMGGAQINLDFSMRPDLITFPVPSISGSAAVPSTVDVLVNGTHVMSGEAIQGPFQVPQLPVISGGGLVTTTVTDALGRQVTTQLPFYASPFLLAPGLQTYSGEIGLVRRNWGAVSNDYGALAGSITYRRGLSSHLTVEGHGEHTEALTMGGAGAVLNIADFAVANLAIAGSSWSGRNGLQVSAGVERITPNYGLGVSIIRASRDFGDLAAANGDPIVRLELNANASVSLARLGSLGIAYTEVKRDGVRGHGGAANGVPVPGELLPIFAEHSKLLTASYSTQIGRASFYATAFRDFSGDHRTTGLIGVTIPLGHRISGNVSAQLSGGRRAGQVELSRSAIVPGDWGFRIFAAGDQQASPQVPDRGNVTDHEFAQITYKSRFGQFYVGADRVGGETTFQGEMIGALSLIDGALFASNRIDDSFAIVDTGGAAGIRVRQENRDVGRTDAGGRILVPDLRSFEINRLSIEPLDAPITADVPLTSREVRPQDRSGVVVRLPVKVRHGALLRMIGPSGKPIQVGSIATLKSTGIAVPVGYDGEAYVLDLSSHNEILVEEADGRRCIVEFDYHDVPGQIPVLGPLSCKVDAQ